MCDVCDPEPQELPLSSPSLIFASQYSIPMTSAYHPAKDIPDLRGKVALVTGAK